MTHLRATQEAMRAALHDGDDARLRSLVGPASEARIEVYRTMYWARQIEALAEDFPAVRRMLGAPLFERVAVTHLRRNPSRHPSTAFLGRGMSETLTHLGQGAEAAVAELEWARVVAFWAPHVEPATPALLGGLGDRFGDVVLGLHPSLQLLVLPAFARAALAVDVATTDLAPEPVAVWRHGVEVEHGPLSTAEAEALRRAMRGERVAAVCEAFLDVEAPEEAAIAALVRWVKEGWVVEARP